MTQLTWVRRSPRACAGDGADERVLVMGEDIGRLGGVFRITDGLLDEFGPTRVIDTPLAESGIVGTAVGLAMRGFRPVVEIQFDGFVYPAFDQIVCQVAKLHYRTRGRVRMPMTIRIPWAGGVGAVEHHSESPEAYFVHTAGLRVVAVSNPQDAYTMLQQAIASDDPVVFFEPKRLYHTKGEVDLDGDVADAAPMGLARVEREGSDVTLLAYGAQVATALDAAIAAEDDGISIEVIDLRSLSPVDYRTVAASVRKTGRVVVTHEAAVRPAWAPRSSPVSPSSASTISKRLRCASRDTTSRIRRPSSRSTTCPTSTGSSTPSIAFSTGRTASRRRRGGAMIAEFLLPDLGEGCPKRRSCSGSSPRAMTCV
jgi:pyruvate dehydrogenase E1 component beta subunit